MLIAHKYGTVFTGRLTKNPEMKTSNSGKEYARLSVSVVTGKKAEGQKYDPSILIDVAVFGSDAYPCSNMEKGDYVTVSAASVDYRDGENGAKYGSAVAEAVTFSATVAFRIAMRAAEAAAEAVVPGEQLGIVDDEDSALPF